MDRLIDTSFRLYKSNVFPEFGSAQQHRIASLVSNYLYSQYISNTSDLIPRYKAPQDIDVSVEAETYHIADLDITTVLIVCSSGSQIASFVASHGKVTLLLKSSTQVFMIHALESLDLETPLALQLLQPSGAVLSAIFNGFKDLVAKDHSVLGEIQLSFLPKQKLTNDSLREILVTIPSQDASVIVQKSAEQPLQGIYDWLKTTTTLRFDNLELSSFCCSLISINSQSMKLLSRNTSEADTAQRLGVVIRGVQDNY